MEFLQNILFSKSGKKRSRHITNTRLPEMYIEPECQTDTLNRLSGRYNQTNTLHKIARPELCTRLPDRYIIPNCLMGTLYQTTKPIHYTELSDGYFVPTTRPIHNTELSDGYFVPDYQTDT